MNQEMSYWLPLKVPYCRVTDFHVFAGYKAGLGQILWNGAILDRPYSDTAPLNEASGLS